MSRLTVSPLDLVMPWLLTAFASHLAPTETLLLWDRIVGYESLLPLPVLAVAVLTFRYVHDAHVSETGPPALYHTLALAACWRITCIS